MRSERESFRWWTTIMGCLLGRHRPDPAVDTEVEAPEPARLGTEVVAHDPLRRDLDDALRVDAAARRVLLRDVLVAGDAAEVAARDASAQIRVRGGAQRCAAVHDRVAIRRHLALHGER